MQKSKDHSRSRLRRVARWHRRISQTLVMRPISIGIFAFLLLGAGPLAWALLPADQTANAALDATQQPWSIIAKATASPIPTVAPLTADQMLERSWASYRRIFIQGDGRTIDPFREQATTSEGQSYSMLRAVWMDDQATFDTVLNWSNNNLRIRGDELFGYLWGKRADGSWGIIDPSVATDADQDIALALIIASHRWGDERYLAQARRILHDMWDATVVDIGGQPYLTAGDWALAQEKPTLNPSYLAPYAYRIFATVDPDRPWMRLVDSSYEVINGCTEQPLDRPSSANLPPNWCAIDKATGAFAPATSTSQPLDSDFGYDAFRTYWRVALDARAFGEPRAIAYLQRSTTLRVIWSQHGSVSAVYHHDGSIAREEEDATVYAGLVANLLVTDPAGAERLMGSKITPLFTERDGQVYWSSPQNYYMQNWLWFGLALYADRALLPPTSATPTPTATTATP